MQPRLISPCDQQIWNQGAQAVLLFFMIMPSPGLGVDHIDIDCTARRGMHARRAVAPGYLYPPHVRRVFMNSWMRRLRIAWAPVLECRERIDSYCHMHLAEEE